MGNDPNSLNDFYSDLDGYLDARKTTKGNPIFLKDPGEYTPSYSSTLLVLDGARYVIAVYGFDDFFPGRLSLYTKKSGLWARTDKFDGDFLV